MPLIYNLNMPFFCGHSSVKDVFAIFVRISFFLEIISPPGNFHLSLCDVQFHWFHLVDIVKADLNLLIISLGGFLALFFLTVT